MQRTGGKHKQPSTHTRGKRDRPHAPHYERDACAGFDPKTDPDDHHVVPVEMRTRIQSRLSYSLATLVVMLALIAALAAGCGGGKKSPGSGSPSGSTSTVGTSTGGTSTGSTSTGGSSTGGGGWG